MWYELFIVAAWFTLVMGGVTFIQQYFYLTYSRHWYLLSGMYLGLGVGGLLLLTDLAQYVVTLHTANGLIYAIGATALFAVYSYRQGWRRAITDFYSYETFPKAYYDFLVPTPPRYW